MSLLPMHIIAGVIGVASAAVALAAVKGGMLHRESGTIFVYSMLLMSSTGALISSLKPNGEGTALGGVLTFYLVVTGLLAIRRRVVGFHGLELGAMLVALVLALTYFTFGVEAMYSATGKAHGYPSPLYFTFGTVTLLAVSGDIRMMAAHGLSEPRRIARHLWRLCFAAFIASGSFFLGRPQAFPKPLRNMALLAIPSMLPLVVMLYWLVRVKFTHQYSRPPLVDDARRAWSRELPAARPLRGSAALRL
jgi:uncharacterized membrane protein